MKAFSPPQSLFGICSLIGGGLAIAAPADRAGPGRTGRLHSRRADKAEPSEGGKLPGRARRGSGLRRRLPQTPGQA